MRIKAPYPFLARKDLFRRLFVNQIFTLSVNFQATNGEAVSNEWTTVTRKGKTILANRFHFAFYKVLTF